MRGLSRQPPSALPQACLAFANTPKNGPPHHARNLQLTALCRGPPRLSYATTKASTAEYGARRDEDPGQALPVATIGLVAANALVFAGCRIFVGRRTDAVAVADTTKEADAKERKTLREVSTGETRPPQGQATEARRWWDAHFTASYHSVVAEGRYYNLLTCNFHHANLPHFLCNAVSLLLLGSELEKCGKKPRLRGLELWIRSALLLRVPCLFLATAVFSTAFQVWQYRDSADSQQIRCLGASGGVCGLLGYAVIQDPRKVVWWFGVVPLPLWSGLAALFAFDVVWPHLGGVKSWGKDGSDGAEFVLSHGAHAAGAVCGGALGLLSKARVLFPSVSRMKKVPLLLRRYF